MDHTSFNAPTLRDRVARSLLEQMQSGVYRVGERLPSLSDLCVQHGVSNITARAALKMLDDAGWVEGRARSGYFVRRRVADGASATVQKTLALLVPSCEAGFFSALVDGAEQAARAGGFRLMVVNSRGNWDLEARLLGELALEVAGLCVMPCNPSPRPYAELIERGVPFLFLDRSVEGLSAPFVATDNEEAGFLLARHLLEVGCERIAVLNDFGKISSQTERLRGFNRALRSAGRAPDPALVRSSSAYGQEAGFLLARALLQNGFGQNEARVGLFCMNEIVASGAYVALREAGVNVPEDVAVGAFDDTLAPHMEPPLSSIHQELERMGECAIAVLIERVRGVSGGRGQVVLLPPRLIVRKSTDAGSPCRVTQMLAAQSVRAALSPVSSWPTSVATLDKDPALSG